MIRFVLRVAALVAVAVPLTPAVSHAGLDGNTFSDPHAGVSFSRPDASWEFRKNLPLHAALGAFVIDEGTAAAVLIYHRLENDELITSASDFAERRDAIAERIAQIAAGTGSPLNLTDARIEARDDRVAFEMIYTSVDPERGPLSNWVRGFILRTGNGQAIFAVRCATSPSTFGAWESQFKPLIASLSYAGQPRTPVYMSRPIPTWWWIAGGIGLFMLVGLLRVRHPETRPLRVPKRAFRAATGISPAVLPSSAASADFPSGDLAPVDFASAGLPHDDVPDILRMTAPGESRNRNDYANTPDWLRVSPETMEEAQRSATAVDNVFWTCQCGRKNPLTDNFCSRCNADRA